MNLWKKSLILGAGLSLYMLWQLISPTEITCTIMEFNIENGGTQVSMPRVLSIIRAANPDIIAIEEAEDNIPLIAKQLGWPYYNSQHQIISRFPIIEPSDGKGIYIFIQLRPGKVIALSNVHLHDEPYGPYLIQQGEPLEKVYSNERKVRLAPLENHLKVLSALAKKSTPTFLVGDFNAPSHLDWAPSAVGKVSHIPFPVEWPVSKAVTDAGFKDSYREIHPDPIAHPGYTWWAHRPKVNGWNPQHSDPHDRIDFIYAAGPVQTIASKRVGSCCTNCDNLDLQTWPSDHCAVVSTFQIYFPYPFLAFLFSLKV
jgi:endonuclease/exonuclease/phosphatase family metal-dependent hydrolase